MTRENSGAKGGDREKGRGGRKIRGLRQKILDRHPGKNDVLRRRDSVKHYQILQQGK